MTRRGWALFAALGLIWGVPYLFLRIAVQELDPVVVAFGRTSIGALLLLPLAIRARALRPLLARWKALLAYTVVEIIGPWVLLGHAETRLDSSTTGLLIATVPIVAALLLTALGHDRLDARRVTGLEPVDQPLDDLVVPVVAAEVVVTTGGLDLDDAVTDLEQ